MQTIECREVPGGAGLGSGLGSFEPATCKGADAPMCTLPNRLGGLVGGLVQQGDLVLALGVHAAVLV